MKDRFGRFLAVSGCLHILFFFCFLQSDTTIKKYVEPAPEADGSAAVPGTQEEVRGTVRERFEKLAEKYADDEKRNELWQHDSTYIKELITRGDRLDGRELLLLAQRDLAMDEMRREIDEAIGTALDGYETYDTLIAERLKTEIREQLEQKLPPLLDEYGALFPEDELQRSLEHAAQNILADKMTTSAAARHRKSSYQKMKALGMLAQTMNAKNLVPDMYRNPQNASAGGPQGGSPGNVHDGTIGRMHGGSSGSRQKTSVITQQSGSPGVKGFAFPIRDGEKGSYGYPREFTDWVAGKPWTKGGRNYDDWDQRDDDMLRYLKEMKDQNRFARMVRNKLFSASKMAERTLPEAKIIRPEAFRDTGPGNGRTAPYPEQVYTGPVSRRKKKKMMDGSLVTPSFPFNAWGAAVRATRPVRIDGYLDEWDKCRPYALYGSVTMRADVPGTYLLVQWDNRGLYFAYRIRDVRDNSYNAYHPYNNDIITLFLDPQNLKTRRKYKKCDDGKFQYYVLPRLKRAGVVCNVNAEPARWEMNDFTGNGIRHASLRRGNEYTVEGFIPAALWDNRRPQPGSIMGFSYLICNGETDVPGRLVEYLWTYSPNVHLLSYLWGDLLLMGTDAAFLMDEHEPFLPGHNLTVRISDPDMNLADDRKDKLWARISSGTTGDTCTVELMETEINNGVFKTVVPTVFGFEPRPAGPLVTSPGDAISITYLDQFGTGGRRLVIRRKVVRVGRGVMKLNGNGTS